MFRIKKHLPKIILFILAIIFFEAIILALPPNDSYNIIQNSSEEKFSEYAQQIVQKCAQSKHHPTCYEEEVPKLMVVLSMEDAFQVTKLVQNQDKSFPYCHVLGHKLSAREIDKDPSKWKEVVNRCPSGVCSNGCIHGGFQERFRAESFTDEQIEQVKPDLKTICEDRSTWHPTGLEQASCYHALGHLTMYLTSADINKATVLCEEIAIKNDGRNLSQLCFDGAFMQIYQPLEPEDFALIKGKEISKDQAVDFCNNFSGKKKASCWSESWPLFSEQIRQPMGLVDFCSKAEESDQERCYSGLFYVLTAQFNFDTEKVKNFCNGLPKDKMGLCFANASSRLIETDYRNIDEAISLCEQSNRTEVKDECFSELVKYSDYNFHRSSIESTKLCNSLPQPWSEQCLEKNSR